MILAALAGAMLPIQVAINTNLAKHGAGAVWAAMISFAVGTIALALFFVGRSTAWPARAELAAAPWWAWVGGVLGAFYVAATIYTAPKLGAALLFALVVGGQMTMSSSLDHVGAFGLPQVSFSAARGAGILLIVAGVVLVQRT